MKKFKRKNRNSISLFYFSEEILSLQRDASEGCIRRMLKGCIEGCLRDAWKDVGEMNAALKATV